MTEPLTALDIKRGKHTIETKKKMSLTLEGRKHSKETIEKISKANFKRWAKISKEEKRRIMHFCLTANPSSLEKAIWEVLDNLDIKYETQYKIGSWYVDIYIPIKNLVIECNGNYWHNYDIFPEKKIRDNALEKYAKDNRYKFIWLWEDEIRKDPVQALKEGIKCII